MRRTALLTAILAFLGACSSGGSGCGEDPKKTSGGQTTPMSGGSGGGRGGSLGEGVSFQGLTKKPAPAQQAASGQPAPSASAPAAPSGPQAVICGGFPDLPGDCLRAPAFNAIKAKCCPTGYIERCQGIPGGARLTGSGCTPKS
ncbi:MAG: hypothetical protein ACHQ51_15660 [Elusimicrobiota bacterium]